MRGESNTSNMRVLIPFSCTPHRPELPLRRRLSSVSPRLSLARYFPSTNLIVHFSYDRIFQTPSSANILLASSADVQPFNSFILRLPVEPSRGNYLEFGAAKSLFGQLRVDAKYSDAMLTTTPTTTRYSTPPSALPPPSASPSFTGPRRKLRSRAGAASPGSLAIPR